jgi:hypothetical protein
VNNPMPEPAKSGPLPGVHYFWTYLDETGNRRRMRWMMTPETAAEHTALQGLECDLSSAETRAPAGGAGDIGPSSTG